MEILRLRGGDNNEYTVSIEYNDYTTINRIYELTVEKLTEKYPENLPYLEAGDISIKWSGRLGRSVELEKSSNPVSRYKDDVNFHEARVGFDGTDIKIDYNELLFTVKWEVFVYQIRNYINHNVPLVYEDITINQDYVRVSNDNYDLEFGINDHDLKSHLKKYLY